MSPIGDGEAGMSYETGREEILKIRDPAAEHARVIREKAGRLPPVQITELAASLQDQGNEEGARQVLRWGIQEGAIVAPEEEGVPEEEGGPVAPAGPSANGTVPAGGDPNDPMTALAELLDQIKTVLMEGGISEEDIIALLTPFVRFLDGEDAPTTEAIRTLAQILVEAGLEPLAQALAEIANALGLLEQAPTPA